MKKAELQHDLVVNTLTKDHSNPSTILSATDLVVVNILSQLVDSTTTAVSNTLASRIFYVRSALDRTISAFSKLTSVYGTVLKLVAGASRVCELIDVLDYQAEVYKKSGDTTQRNVQPENESEPHISLEEVDIVTPDNDCLASGMNINVPAGKSIMITGPNSVGKTSFFRVISGLWPLKRGRVVVPQSITLVPQKVYSVSGTLAYQVTYPQFIPKSKRTEADEKCMTQAMTKAGVDKLIKREGWDEQKRWEDCLSLGEQQRIGLARLFFNNPAFAVLDECTDAVSQEDEKTLYEQLHEQNITCITISKRLGLEEHHQLNLELGVLDDPKGWRVKDITVEDQDNKVEDQDNKVEDQDNKVEEGDKDQDNKDEEGDKDSAE